MGTVSIFVVMGLWCDPAGDCHGIRTYLNSLSNSYDIEPFYGSYLTDPKILANAVPQYAPEKPKSILIGHSKGGHAVIEMARNLLKSPTGHLESLIPIEPVNAFPDTIDGPIENYDPVVGVDVQHCFYSSLPFHLGHKYRVDSFNTGVPFDHNGVCTAPETLAWIKKEVQRLSVA